MNTHLTSNTLSSLVQVGSEAFMHVICSWCGKYIKEKEPLEDESISHGMCQGCCKKAKIKIKKPEEKKNTPKK